MKKQIKHPKTPIVVQLPTDGLAKITGGQAPAEERKKS